MQAQAVTQDTGRGSLDVGGRHEGAVIQVRQRLGHALKRQAGARTAPQRHLRVNAAARRDGRDVPAQLILYPNPAYPAPRLHQLIRRGDGPQGINRVAFLKAGEHLRLLRLAGVAHRQPQQKAVQLRLGQAVGALELDGVLGRHHHEGLLERVRHATLGDLPLAHRFQQRRLGFGSRPVDLVGQQQAGKDGAGHEYKLAAPVHAHPGHVAGQQVGRELHPLEAQPQADRQGAGQHGFAGSRRVFEQDVPACQNARQREAGHGLLAHQHGGDIG